MDLICFSHLRWNFVYQRPQHLMKRAAENYTVHFFEEPLLSDKPDGYSKRISTEGVNIITPNLKEEHDQGINKRLENIFRSFLNEEGINDYFFWYYTALMRQFTESFHPKIIIYDCMDELSAFKNASSLLLNAEENLLKDADLVFTGGESLYKAKKHLHKLVSCFPSSIDYEHFAAARTKQNDPADQEKISFPRIGFFGVVDERFDIELLRNAADLKSDYQFIIIGPVVKIDSETLPKNKNIHYLGMKTYEELPAYISNWDVAFMPFALNEATKFISPTKTPEFLAAGLPVISTAIQDVISTYGDAGLAKIIQDEHDLIDGIEFYLTMKDHSTRLEFVDSFLKLNSWDITWYQMNDQIQNALNPLSKTFDYV